VVLGALKPAASRNDAIARYRKHTEGAGFFGVCASLQTFIGATASLATLKGQGKYRPTLTHQRSRRGGIIPSVKATVALTNSLKSERPRTSNLGL
jgi:hypothetical protein